MLDAPKAGVLDAPNAAVLDDPNTGVLEAPNEPPDPNKGALETPNAEPVLPNVGVVVEPKAGVLAAPKAGELVAPKAGVLEAPNVGWLDAPKGEEEPNRLLPNAGCDCWNVLPNGLVWVGVALAPKPPKTDFCPKREEPPNDDEELPKAGVDEAPNPGVVLPKAGDDEAPKVGVEVKGEEDWAAPNTPVEVPPKMEPPVCEPKGVVAPKGLGAKGLLLALLACPKTG